MAESRSDRDWRYTCDYCQSNLSGTVRIRCAECPDFDTCVTCFSQGIELGPHKNNHKYQVVTPNFFPIFTEDWSADEELLLIEGIQQFGMGNWMDIAEHVRTKNKDECEKHYQIVYLESPQWPLPRFIDKKFDASKPATRPPALKKPRPTPSNPRLSKPLSSQPTNHEIQGYMPARLEFELEYENDAENSVKDLVFNPDDLPEDTELKLVMMDIYNGRLDKRIERKRFLSDRGLLEYKKMQTLEKKRSKEERDLWNKGKVFARLQTHEDYLSFMQGLQREAQLRQQIAMLQDYRQNGITTLKEGEQFEQARHQRWQTLRAHGIKEGALAAKRVSGSSNNINGGGGDGAVVTSTARGRHAPHPWHFDTDITSSIPTDPTYHHYQPFHPPQLGGNHDSFSFKPPHGLSATTPSTPSRSMSSVPSTPRAGPLRIGGGGNATNGGGNGSGVSTPTGGSMGVGASGGARRPANPLNLDNAEGVHLLSPEEQQLCSVLRILPRPYIVIKETILKEYASRGSLRRREARELIKIDVNKTSRLYDFFLSMGWITAPGRTALHWQAKNAGGGGGAATATTN
ncbi:Transcriptional adapter ada2 [Dimargaris cristalligena]|nr:Transcriptional adapter ada2 [Dimargaris cristalligena]